MDLREVGDAVSQVGIVGLLGFVLYALHKGWWVPGRTHSEVVAERNELKNDLKSVNLDTKETLKEVREHDRLNQEKLLQLSLENERLRRKEKENAPGS